MGDKIEEAREFLKAVGMPKEQQGNVSKTSIA